MLHVMVPDKHNPSFDGNVVLDYRTVHLIECVDGKTDALFNNIIRNSVVRVKWDLDWFEEVYIYISINIYINIYLNIHIYICIYIYV
jgi:hypothetical protein